MLKIAALALGLLTVGTIAPSALSTGFQNNQAPQDISSNLHAEKLLPLKKSAKLAPMVIRGSSVSVPIDRKVQLSPESKERQRIKSECQPELGNRNQFGSNERAVGLFENSTTANSSNNSNSFGNSNNFNSSVSQGNCGFTIPF